MRAEQAVSLRAWVAVLGGLFGCFMAGMNVHVTSAALPEIRGSLGASFEEGSWISTAYLVAEIVMIPPDGLAGGGVLPAPGDVDGLAGLPDRVGGLFVGAEP